MKATLICDDDHLACVHSSIRKLMRVVDSAETTEYDDSGVQVAVVGMRTDHWRQFVLATDEPDRYLQLGVFTITRPDGGVLFIVPVDNVATPKILDDDEQQLLIAQQKSRKRHS